MSNNHNPNKKVFDLSEYENKIDRLIAQQYSTWLMSNSKWRKLFTGLDIEGLLMNQVLLKRVGQDLPRTTHMPKADDLGELWVAHARPRLHGADARQLSN